MPLRPTMGEPDAGSSSGHEVATRLGGEADGTARGVFDSPFGLFSEVVFPQAARWERGNKVDEQQDAWPPYNRRS